MLEGFLRPVYDGWLAGRLADQLGRLVQIKGDQVVIQIPEQS